MFLENIALPISDNHPGLTDLECLINRNDIENASPEVLAFLNNYAYSKPSNIPIVLDGNPYLIYKKDMDKASSAVRQFLAEYGYMIPFSSLQAERGVLSFLDIPKRSTICKTNLSDLECIVAKDNLRLASHDVLLFFYNYACVQPEIDPFILDDNPYLIYKKDMVNASSDVKQFLAEYGYMIPAISLRMKETASYSEENQVVVRALTNAEVEVIKKGEKAITDDAKKTSNVITVMRLFILIDK